MWVLNRAKFCLICGTELQDKCLQYGEAIASFQYRFCPMCGTPYKKRKLCRCGGDSPIAIIHPFTRMIAINPKN
ncbi:hypothetical protein [Laspinema palackyanum]|uniref:hypothetical protein n=1 Tax=Laspinema palackyanum TaxID=3231601 RepID=UPI003F6839F8